MPQVLGFNGSSDYVDIGTGPTSVKTISFWAYPASTTEYFINLTSNTDYIWANAGTVTATGFASPTIYVNGIPSTTIAAGSWQHITVTTDTAENASNFDIGRTQDTNYLEGRIDDLTLYDYARTPAQVAHSFNRGLPVGHWNLDQCQGSQAYDASMFANHGIITEGGAGTNVGVGTCGGSAGTMWADGASGKFNASLEFDGTDDYVDIGDTGFTAVRSVSFWAKPDSTTQEFLQLSATDTVAVSSGAISVGGFGTETIYVDGRQTTAFPDTNWHHITVISDTDITANDMDLGRISTNYGAGLLDDIRIYNYALSPDQIKIIMNNGAVRFR
jgi:hypothetical protein